MGGAAKFDFMQSRLSSATRQSVMAQAGNKVRYVNLQALIDREIIMDQMI